jgi:ketosteroid isomerase-like protein
MSQENVEIVRRATEAYNRRDFAESIRWVDPEVEWDMSRIEVPEAEVYRGYDGLRTFSQRWDESWESVTVAPEEFIDAGNKVISVVHQVGRGKASGVEVDQRFAQLWTLRDGKIIRMEMYRDREAALEAAGLSEQDTHR